MKEAFVGFDSAWGRDRSGAVAWAVFEDEVLKKAVCPRLASFDVTAQIIENLQGECDDVLIAIDQPIIVPNSYGIRPVDPVAHSLMDALHSVAQFSNRRGDRRNQSMFGDNAPVWQFTGMIGPQGYSGSTNKDDWCAFVDYQAAMSPSERTTHLIEVYPALALPALQPTFMQHRNNRRRWAARYNPEAKTFPLDDWRLVCEVVVSYANQFHLQTLSDWAGKIKELAQPVKEHQDKVDAAVCLIIAIQWRQGRQSDGMCVIGDLDTGYIVTPTSDDTKEILQNAVDRRVPLDCR